MAKIERHIIDRILDAARIEEVVGDFVKLRKTGVRYTGLCPFHDDRHDGNFIVYPRGNCFRCFTCESKGGSVEFLMKRGMSYPEAIRWLGGKYGIDVDGMPANWTPPPPRPTPPPIPTLNLPMTMVIARENYEKDPLVEWIRTGVHWGHEQRARIDDMMAAYHIGHCTAISDQKRPPYNLTSQDFTIFWEIDDHQRVRTGKMMRYKADGHRDKDTYHNFDFIHAMLLRPRIQRDSWGNAVLDGNGEPVMVQPYLKIYDEEKQEVRHCLFGLHLIDRYGRDPVINIVESEKTALLMAIAYGNHMMGVWMACGGEGNLTRERLLPIINRRLRVRVYPDRDGIGKWLKKAKEIGYDRLSVDVKPVTDWWQPGDGEKADIADVVIRHINQHPYIHSVGDVIKKNENVKLLIDKLNLEIVDNGTTEQRTV